MKKIAPLLVAILYAFHGLTQQHPILFASTADFTALKQRCETDERCKLAKERILYDANGLLPLKPCLREMEGRRLLGVSRRVLWRITTLSMAYRLTDDKRYAQRCAEEMTAVAAFTDWNPSHFLDVAEMTLAMAIGYDWLYATFSKEDAKTIEEAILNKGLQAGQKTTGWVNAKNNWGQVCHAGMMAGALVTRSINPALAEATIKRAIEKLPLSMAALAPKGSYPEGPGYWAYGIEFNTLAIAMLECVEKTDHGLLKLPGFSATAEYPDLVTGPSNIPFNYADCSAGGRGSSCATWWFAKRLNRPDLLDYSEDAAFRRYCAQRSKGSDHSSGDRLFVFSLLWNVPSSNKTDKKTPLNWSSEGPIPITIQRTSWNNDEAVFVGLKAGVATGPHGHMDVGSFVYDALGVRWAIDLGMEGYNAIEKRGMGLWGMQQNSDRWKIYRLSSFSHNSLTIDNELHKASGFAKVVDFKDNGKASKVTIDLSPVFPQVKQVTRIGEMKADGIYTLTDTLTGLKPGACVRWQMMTQAIPSETRTGSIVLSSGKKQLKLSALHASNTQWQVNDASKPVNEWDSPNKDCKLIFCEQTAPSSSNLTFSITFEPLR
ncbi:MAG: heparinase II/III family protein [bacterium]